MVLGKLYKNLLISPKAPKRNNHACNKNFADFKRSVGWRCFVNFISLFFMSCASKKKYMKRGMPHYETFATKGLLSKRYLMK